MKPLQRLFGRLRSRVEESPFERMTPLLEATENFFLWSDEETDRPPHVRDPLDVKRYMSMVIVALVPAVIAGIYLFGLRVLGMILVSYMVGGTVEVIFACIRREEINEGFLVTGLIFPLVLPPGTPYWGVAIGVASGVIIGKELFGGTGRNPFNAALVGRAVVTIGFASLMRSWWIEPVAAWPGRLLEYASPVAEPDAVTMATPLAEAAAKTPELAPWSDLLWGNVAGSVGETCVPVILFGAAVLVVTRVADWRSILGTLGAFAGLGYLLAWAAPAAFGPQSFGPIGWHLVAGGLMFGGVFMATDPVTSPITGPAKLIYGIVIGTLVLLIRALSGNVEGVTFAILLGNIAAPAFDELVVQWRMRRYRS